MADVSVTYVSKKIKKLRWKPETYTSLQNESIFAAGSWDDNKNSISFWKCPSKPSSANQSVISGDISDVSPDLEPELICQAFHKGDVTDLIFLSSDLLVSTSNNGSVNLYKFDLNNINKVENWENLHHYKNKAAAACTGVASKGEVLATVGESGQICSINIHKKQSLWNKEADSCSLTTVCYVRQQEIVVGNIRGHLKLWDLKSKPDKASKTLSQSGQQASISCLSQHPNQAHVIISGDKDGLFSIWDLRQDHYPVSVLSGHSAAISEIKFHPLNPEILYTASYDGCVWQWNASNIKGPSNSQSNKLGGVKLTGFESSNRNNDNVMNPWLNCDAAKHRLDVTSLLPVLTTPINSLDIENTTLICSSDNEAIYIVSDLK